MATENSCVDEHCESLSLAAKHVKPISSMNVEEPSSKYIIKSDCFGVSNTFAVPASIPVIDLSLLSISDSNEHNKLKSALSSWGCFQAIGHGISTSLVEKILECTKEFFALPSEEKEKYGRAANVEGYGNDPMLSDSQVLDWSYRLMLKLQPIHERNFQLWPTTPKQFSELVCDYYEKMKHILDLVLKAMARSLNLEEDFFISLFGSDEIMMARFCYYPVCSKPELVLGAKAHSDGSGITLVLPDQQVEGLQIFNSGQWFKVPIIRDDIVINMGDQMEIMSNGIFKSPFHRVSVSSEKERISLAVFYLPNRQVEIGPAKEFIDDERPQIFRKVRNYPDINFECVQNGKITLDTIRI